MKFKKRRVSEVPPSIKNFISTVASTPPEKIEVPLKDFVWEFDKGDFYNWIELFNQFDVFFEKYTWPRKDLQIEDNFLNVDPLFPRDAVLEILRVMRIILENCANKHFYSSFERHLSLLLASSDADVVESSLQTLYAYLKRAVGRCSIRDSSLTSKLFSLAQGWGGKEEGLGILACSLENGCDPVACEIGSTLHFEFYGNASKGSNRAESVNQGWQVIHLPQVSCSEKDALVLLHNLTMDYNVPINLRFSLFTRLRFANAFCSLASRRQYIRILLYAFIVLVQSSNNTDEMATFFTNEPGFVDELLSLLKFEDEVPEEIRILGILSLVALCHDSSQSSSVLSAVTVGGHNGILPSLMQKSVASVTCVSTGCSITFAEALLSLISILVSSTSGSLALHEAGFIPTMLPLLNDTNPHHLHLVSAAVHIIEGFLDYHSPSSALLRDIGGLDKTISRLKIEVSALENAAKKNQDLEDDGKGKRIAGSFADPNGKVCSDGLVSYHRRLLVKALLRTISLATYVPGSSNRVNGSEETILPSCLSIIFRRAKDFGGGVFALAANVMTDLIHRDPTCFSVLSAADVPSAFLDAIGSGVPCSWEAITCIPQCLDALCLNNRGLQFVKDSNALRCFVTIFTSSSYLRALNSKPPEEDPRTLYSGLEELLRHASSLRSSAVDMVIEIFDTIYKIGSGSYPSNEPQCSSANTPMDIDLEEREHVLHGDQETSKIGSSELMAEASVDATSVTVKSYLPECLSNAARLLEIIVQNTETCRLFVENGIDVVLKLFTTQFMPTSLSNCQSLPIVFKKFSTQHLTVVKSVTSFIKEQLKFINDFFSSLSGFKVVEIEYAKQTETLKCISCLEGLLSLSTSLVKGTNTMISELGSADAHVLKELAKIYREILWQISLTSDFKVDNKQGTDQGIVATENPISGVPGREGDDDGNSHAGVQYMNLVSVRNSIGSNWNIGRTFSSVVRSGGSLHRHSRQAISRIRGGRISRFLDSSHTDSDGMPSSMDNSHVQQVKKRRPDVLLPEYLSKVRYAIHSFLATVVKALPSRQQGDTISLGSASRNILTAIAKLFLDALSFSGHTTAGQEILLAVKCRYLGKVVEDMASLTVDRHRKCNMALVNCFYVNGTLKEVLTTFAATSQLLWTMPFSIRPDQQSSVVDNVSHCPWLLETLISYCRLLDYYVNSSLLLGQDTATVQMLVQPAAAELSIGLFHVPKTPELFVRMLQSQILEVVLPVWNHPLFPNCCPTFVSSLVSIVNHIYVELGEVKPGHNDVKGSISQRFVSPSIDESAITTITEMGFSRMRAEEALRSVGVNSVELAMDWLFTHPEEPVHEDVQIAQALALSLGNSLETSKEDNSDSSKDAFMEERGAEEPPVELILSVAVKLFRGSDAVAFSLTDMFATLCNRNKAKDCHKVVLYLVQQLKLCPSDFSNDIDALCSISHVLALLLREEGRLREIAAENGIVSSVFGILSNFRLKNELSTESSAIKAASYLLLVLDNLLQYIPKVDKETTEGNPKSLSDPSAMDISLANSSAAKETISAMDGLQKESTDVFERILGKSTGYLTFDESKKALTIACDLIKQNVPAIMMQAVLQLCARLTKTNDIAMQFLESGTLTALLNLPSNCLFPGFDIFASAIIRHLIEDPQTLQTSMELEIRQTLMGTSSRHAAHLSPRMFLTSMVPLISRNPQVFMRAAAAVCCTELSGGRLNVVLLKEKDKEKDKSKNFGAEEPIQIPESKLVDTPTKFSRSFKRVPANLQQVVEHLLETLMVYPSSKRPEEGNNSPAPIEIDEPAMKEKGKSKIDDSRKISKESIPERSASLATLSFILKVLSEVLLLYVHAAGIILRYDIDHQSRPDQIEHGGVLRYVLHNLLPLSLEETDATSNEWKKNLSEKASCFFVVLCGRSTEGRRRVISEIVKAFTSFSNSEGNSSSRFFLLPDERILAFTELVNSILSRNSSSNLPGPGCSPDIAKVMIDCGMMQCLSGILQVIDLDHPNAPKVANLILKALESLTRAANSSQILKLDGLGRKRSSDTQERTDNQIAAESEAAIQNVDFVQEATIATQTTVQLSNESLHESDGNVTPGHPMEQNTQVTMEDNLISNPPAEGELEFMAEEMDEGGVLPNENVVGLPFQVDHHNDDGIGDEDDDDVGEDVEDEDDDDEDDDDVEEDTVAGGARLMALADTDADEHDEHGMTDDYTDEMIDEEDDYHVNTFSGWRWDEGLTGIDRFGIIRRSGDRDPPADFGVESFRRADTDDVFHFHRQLNRRQNGNRTSLDRSRIDGSSIMHPLLVRSSQSSESTSSLWPAAENSTRGLDAWPFGGSDVNNYSFSAVFSSGHNSLNAYGERLVAAGAPVLSDISVGIDSFRAGGRRGPGDSRWSDDGQPHTVMNASAIAHAVEDHFMSQLQDAASVDNAQYKVPADQINEQASLLDVKAPLDLNAQTMAGVDLADQSDAYQYQNLGNNTALQSVNSTIPSDAALPNLPHTVLDAQSTFSSEDFQEAPETRHTLLSDMDNMDNDLERVLGREETLGTSTDNDLHGQGFHLENGSQLSANPCNDFVPGQSNLESHSSSHALISSGSGAQELSDANVGSVSTDIDMNTVGTDEIPSRNNMPLVGGESLSGQILITSQGTDQSDQVNINPVATSPNSIDPTFLEALPEDLRAEVLASQQASQPAPSNQNTTYAAPPTEEIDPEFLAALPPDIQIEVLAQQHAQQRAAQMQEAEGQPVDMDNASIIATFPPDLREEVLLTSSDAVLSQLPPSLVAEAQMLRDRRNSNRYSRMSVFGSGHRLGRRLPMGQQTVMDRGVGVTIGRRMLAATTSSSKVKEVEGAPLLDADALKALVRLLRLAQPLSKGLLQRLLLNLCAHSVTRGILVDLLIHMIKPEADGPGCSVSFPSHRLYGCRWNVVYGRPRQSNGLPPLVSRRILENLTYLATNHPSVASSLFYCDPSSSMESSSLDAERERSHNGASSAGSSEETDVASMPLVLFLKLLQSPLFLRSNTHLEQVMGLVQVVVNNAVKKVNYIHRSEEAANGNENQTTEDQIDNERNSLASQQNPMEVEKCTDVPSLGSKRSQTLYDVLLKIPQSDLRNICYILSHEGLSEKMYTNAADVVKKLSLVAVPHRKFYTAELAGLAQNLSSAAVTELRNLRDTQMLGISVGSMAGAAILRVLQALSVLVSADWCKDDDIDEEQSLLWNLNLVLEPLWQELSECMSVAEAKVGHASAFPSVSVMPEAGEVGGSSSLSPPLPPSAQKLLPFIEAFFVLCEKLQTCQNVGGSDSTATAREVKEFIGSSLSPAHKTNLTISLSFPKVAEKHRRLLNIFIRQNPSLLEKSLSMMLKVPRLIDFDNKRSYFRSGIRQQHEQHHSASLRISVRRAYILEDSYNQLRLRSSQDLRGRLTVQFQGEEGIDAGGLTREWYQLLSRVIFDKGTLLFTTVGNDATFQPNPNSVYQPEHLSYFKFVGRVVAKALFDGQLMDVYFTRSFYKHILGVKVTYHDIEAVDPDYYKNLKWMLENDVTDIPDLTFSMDADEEKHILYEKNQVTDYELKPGGRNIRVTEETKHEYVDLVAEHILTNAIRPQINSFLEGFSELVSRELISIFNDKELELLISGLPEIDYDDLKANTEYTGYSAASNVIQWFWQVVKSFNKEDMAKLLQFVTGTSKVPLGGFKALQGISGPQRFQIHKAYGAPSRLPSAHTCFNQLDLPEYSSREQLEERLLLAIHEASEGFGFG